MKNNVKTQAIFMLLVFCLPLASYGFPLTVPKAKEIKPGVFTGSFSEPLPYNSYTSVGWGWINFDVPTEGGSDDACAKAALAGYNEAMRVCQAKFSRCEQDPHRASLFSQEAGGFCTAMVYVRGTN